MKTKRFINFIKFATISGNIIFIFSIFYERLTEIFAVTFEEFVAYMTLAILLATNTFLVGKSRRSADMNGSPKSQNHVL